MLTFDDCLDMTELSEQEVEAISEREHCPEIIALALGHYVAQNRGQLPFTRQHALSKAHRAFRPMP